MSGGIDLDMLKKLKPGSSAVQDTSVLLPSTLCHLLSAFPRSSVYLTCHESVPGSCLKLDLVRAKLPLSPLCPGLGSVKTPTKAPQKCSALIILRAGHCPW